MFCYLTRRLRAARPVCSGLPSPLVLLALGAAGLGVANEKRWGYWLGVVLAAFYVLIDVYCCSPASRLSSSPCSSPSSWWPCFLHPQSREYQRIWFH